MEAERTYGGWTLDQLAEKSIRVMSDPRAYFSACVDAAPDLMIAARELEDRTARLPDDSPATPGGES